MAVKKKRITKRQMKEDPLVTYSLRFSRYAKEHFNQIVAGVAILIAIIGILIFTSHSRRASARQSEQYIGAALMLLRQGDIAAAKTSFEDVANRYPGSRAGITALYFKAECELKMRDFAEAMRSYDAYLSKCKEFPDFKTAAIIGKAACLEGVGKYAEAASTLELLVETIDPDDPRYMEVLFHIASFYRKAEMIEKAIPYFQQLAQKGSGALRETALISLALLENRE